MKYYAKVDSTSSKNLQICLFTLGFEWGFGEKMVSHTDRQYIIITSEDKILRWRRGKPSYEELIYPEEFKEEGWTLDGNTLYFNEEPVRVILEL